MADIPEVDVEVDPNNYEESLRDVLNVVRPTWKRDNIKFKYLTQGYVNHMLACFTDEDNKDDWIVARIFGTDVELGQKRDQETNVAKLFAEQKIGPPVYGVFKNGILFKFMKGKTFFWTDISAFQDIKLCKSVARTLAKVHSKQTSKLAMEKYGVNAGMSMIKIMEALTSNPLPDVIIDEETTEWFKSQIPPIEERSKEVKMLMAEYQHPSIPNCMCHGDCNSTNMIYDEDKDEITLCDFEAADISAPLWDLTMFLGLSSAGQIPDPEGMEFSREFKMEFFIEYLREKNRLDGEPEGYDERLLSQYLALEERTEIGFNYLWQVFAPSLALAPERHGQDNKFFLRLGLARLQYYNRHRERMLSIEIPE